MDNINLVSVNEKAVKDFVGKGFGYSYAAGYTKGMSNGFVGGILFACSAYLCYQLLKASLKKEESANGN